MTSLPPDTSVTPPANSGPGQCEECQASFTYCDEGAEKAGCIELIIDAQSWLTVSEDFAFAGKAALLALAQPPRDPAIKSPHRLAVIMLSDDRLVQGLNRTYRGKDKPTNILSFPALQPLGDEPERDKTSASAAIEPHADHGDDDEPTHIGDAILGYDTIVQESERDGIPLKNHISHLVIHGVLHLLGYDHEEAAQASEMEALETKLLQQLNIPDPYCHPA